MDRTDIEECECPVEGHMTGCPNDLWAKALCDLERGKEPVATVVDELCDLALRGLERGAEPVAWMTAESMSRIEKGGNGSRQTVPVHSKPSCVAKIPLYASAPPAASGTVQMPAEMDDELRFILGQPNFWCSSVATKLRRLGKTIPAKAEEEQAAVLHWMLQKYATHGPAGWITAADSELSAAPEVKP